MLNCSRWPLRFSAGLLALAGGLLAAPVLAQQSLFETITLPTEAGETTVTVRGYSQGNFGLDNIARRDRNGNLCIGYASDTPDHILRLQQDAAQVQIVIDSQQKDTTLLIQGPDDNSIICASAPSRREDVSLQGRDVPAGTYRVWVGAGDPNTPRNNYTMTVQTQL